VFTALCARTFYNQYCTFTHDRCDALSERVTTLAAADHAHRRDDDATVMALQETSQQLAALQRALTAAQRSAADARRDKDALITSLRQAEEEARARAR
jgi:hypothetical protein